MSFKRWQELKVRQLHHPDDCYIYYIILIPYAGGTRSSASEIRSDISVCGRIMDEVIFVHRRHGVSHAVSDRSITLAWGLLSVGVSTPTETARPLYLMHAVAVRSVL